MKNLNQKSSVLPLLRNAFFIPLTAMLASCSHELVFATHTELGLGVSGDLVNSAPDHITLGYRRKELAYKGRDVSDDTALLGKLDSQTSWSGEVALNELFATGSAANYIASGGSDDKVAGSDSTEKHPLTFASNTNIGFGYNLGGSDDSSIPALYFGYDRKIGTRMKIPEGGSAPPVLAQVSIHSSRLLGAGTYKAPKGGLKDDELISDHNDETDTDKNGAIRIKQSFAIGKGVNQLKKPEIAAKIKADIKK